MCSRTSHFQTTQEFFLICWKAPIQVTLCWRLVTICLAGTDRAQNNNLRGHDLESQVKYTFVVSLRFYQQFLWKRYANMSKKLPKGGQEKKNSRRNSLTDVDTLWLKLRHEGATWRKSEQEAIIWRSLPELSFGTSWVSIHWAVMEIEPPKLCLKSTRIALAKQDGYRK